MHEEEGCSVRQFCVNQDYRCWICKVEEPNSDTLYYKSNGEPGAPRIHPMKANEKEEKKKKDKQEKINKKKDNKINKSKQTLANIMEQNAKKRADAILKKTQKKDFFSHTINSGRANRDVDHVMHQGEIRLDSKHQSKLLNHQVKLSELEEARNKAHKFNSNLGGLILFNKEARSVVVFDYEDWIQWEAMRNTKIKEV